MCSFLVFWKDEVGCESRRHHWSESYYGKLLHFLKKCTILAGVSSKAAVKYIYIKLLSTSFKTLVHWRLLASRYFLLNQAPETNMNSESWLQKQNSLSYQLAFFFFFLASRRGEERDRMPKVIPVSPSEFGVPTLISAQNTQAAAEEENDNRAAAHK